MSPENVEEEKQYREINFVEISWRDANCHARGAAAVLAMSKSTILYYCAPSHNNTHIK